jgi:hypothetical protein
MVIVNTCWKLFRISNAREHEFSSEAGESPIHKFVAACMKLNANDRLDAVLMVMKRVYWKAEHTPSTPVPQLVMEDEGSIPVR